MKITSVEPQKKNQRRFNVFLDGKFAFGADEDLIVDRRLVTEKEINPEDLENILFEAEVGKLMERLYGLFSIRERSEKEVRDYLRRLSFKRKVKGEEEISGLVADNLVEKSKRKGLINDETFARAWMESRLKKYGINRVKQELFQKGIDREIVEKVGGGAEDGKVVAEKALERKLKGWRNLKPFEFRKKATDFLLRRGFDYGTVKEVVEKSLEKL